MVSEQAGISRAAATKAIDATMAVIEAALMRAKKVTLAGFGSFEVHEGAARAGRKVHTRGKVQIDAWRASVFRGR